MYDAHRSNPPRAKLINCPETYIPFEKIHIDFLGTIFN